MKYRHICMADLKLATVGDDVKIWKGAELEAQFAPHGASETSHVSWSPDGFFLATSSVASNAVTVSHFKNPAATVELRTDVKQKFVRFGYTQTRTLITCGDHSDVLLWNVKSRKLQKKLNSSMQAISCVAFNRTDTHIACGSRTGEVMLINVTSGVCNPIMKTPNTTSISSLAFSSKTKSLLGALSEESGFNLWDSNTRSLVHAYGSKHSELATGFAFSPVNDMLAASVGLDKRIVFYDLRKKHIVTSTTLDEPITCLDFMDGANLTVGTTTGRLHSYELRTSSSKHVVRAHESSVNSIQYRKCKVLPKSNGVSWSEPCANDSLPKPSQPNAVAMPRNPFDESVVFSPLQNFSTSHVLFRDSLNDSPTDLLMNFSKHAAASGEVSVMERDETIQGDGYANQCQNLSANMAIDEVPSNASEDLKPLPAASVDVQSPPAAAPIALHSLDLNLLRSMVFDVVDDFAVSTHRDIINLHVDMIKLFQIQQTDFENRLQQVTRNEELLLEEINRLREEIQRLRTGH